jgi:hypothetical protein
MHHKLMQMPMFRKVSQTPSALQIGIIGEIPVVAINNKS